MDDKEIVSALRAAIVDRVGQDRFDLWFGSARFSLHGGVVTITVATDFAQTWLRRTFRREIDECLAAICGANATVEIRVDAAIPPANGAPTTSACAVGAGLATSPTDAASEISCQGDNRAAQTGILKSNNSAKSLTHKLTLVQGAAERPKFPGQRQFANFGSYVVGKGNQLAFASAQMIVDQPGSLSPLFIHGGAGTGKTLLLECIWTAARQSDRRRSVVYLSAEQFTTYFVEALRSGGLPSFRHKYRAVDVLLIDDLQFLAGKRATLMELQHTIDQLQREGRQLVLAADRAPAGLNELGPELITRLSGGMVCPIDPPDQSTRLGIVHQLAARHQLDVPDDVRQYIATHLTSHARELSGALNRLKAASAAQGRAIDRSLAEEALGELIRYSGRAPRLDDITRVVSEVCGVSADVLQSKSKERAVSDTRMLAMWLARKLTRAALSEIGGHFGGRRHSTVISAAKKFEGLIQKQGKMHLPHKSCDAEQLLRQVEARLRVI